MRSLERRRGISVAKGVIESLPRPQQSCILLLTVDFTGIREHSEAERGAQRLLQSSAAAANPGGGGGGGGVPGEAVESLWEFIKLRKQVTVGQNNQKYRLKYWATRSSVRSFARTIHSFACSALFTSLALFRLLAR